MTLSTARRWPRQSSVLFCLWALLALGTAIAYILPLSQGITDHVSNGAFSIAALLMVSSAVSAARREVGIDRFGWWSIAGSVGLGVILLAVDPSGSNEAPSIALLSAPAVVLAILGTVLLFARHSISNIGISRMVLDGCLLSAAMFTALWPGYISPLADTVGLTPSLVAGTAVPIGMAILAVVTFLLVPHSLPGSRVTLLLLGVGAGLLTFATGYNLRLGHEGTLQFGTWYDYLWIPGMAAIGIATMDVSFGRRFQRVLPSTTAHRIVTVAPVVLAAVPFLRGQGPQVPGMLLLVMLILSSVRVMLLISQNDDITTELDVAASRDALTGLLNRRALLKLLEAGRVDAREGRNERSILYIDLDGFKAINDDYGHAAGDHVLLTIAERLLASVRGTDSVARLGGDEFVVVTGGGVARVAADRIRLAVSQPIEWEHHRLRVGCSVGITSDTGIPVPELLMRADEALYLAKDRGGNLIIESDRMTASDNEAARKLQRRRLDEVERTSLADNSPPGMGAPMTSMQASPSSVSARD